MSPIGFEQDWGRAPPTGAPPGQQQAIDSPQMSEHLQFPGQRQATHQGQMIDSPQSSASPEGRPLMEGRLAYMQELRAEQERIALMDERRAQEQRQAMEMQRRAMEERRAREEQQREIEQQQLIQRLDMHRAVPFPTHTYIATNLCVIRPYHVRDIPFLERHANNWNVARWMTNRFPHPYTRADAESWVSCQPRVLRPFEEIPSITPSVQPDGSLLVPWDNTINFVIADPSTFELMGGIGVRPGGDVFNRGAELGYWLAEPYWGKGIMTSAVKAFVYKVFFRTMALRKLNAYVYMRWVREGVYEGNMGSRKVLANAGFKVEGNLKNAVFKRGEWWDQEIWGLLREDVLGDERTQPNGVHRVPAVPPMR